MEYVHFLHSFLYEEMMMSHLVVYILHWCRVATPCLQRVKEIIISMIETIEQKTVQFVAGQYCTIQTLQILFHVNHFI